MASRPVDLHVYDLSNGMAAQFSESILGKRIELVPHTGVLVFGLEYFFGGGIQRLHPSVVVSNFGIRPVKTIRLGTTTKTQEEASEFLRSISHKYTAATYDLLTNNCNNFSDEFARFLCGNGVPDDIINLPQEVLNTPIGGMLRPMLEQSQNAIAGHAQDGDLGSLTSMFGGATPGDSPTVGTPVAAPAPTPATAPTPQSIEALAQRHSKPLVAHDRSSVAAAATHLLALGVTEEGGGATRCPLTADQRSALRTAFMAGRVDDAAAPVLLHVLDAWPADRAAASALALLRQFLAEGSPAQEGEEGGDAAPLPRAALHVLGKLGDGAFDAAGALARALAWTALANAAAHQALFGEMRKHGQWGACLSAAVNDVTGEAGSEVRRAAAAFLVNVARQAAGDADLRIQLGCGLAENVLREQDEAALWHRLLALTHLLHADEDRSLSSVLASMSLEAQLAQARGRAQPVAQAIAAHIRV